MKNTPSYMRSIWSENYSVFESDMPLNSKGNNDEFVLKNLNRVNTKGLEKTINSNELLKKGKLNDSISSSPSVLSPSNAKRKLQSDENKTPVQKKAKLNEIKIDIDNLLGEYTTNANEPDELEASISQSSSYFSSSNQMSPILTKVRLINCNKKFNF